MTRARGVELLQGGLNTVRLVEATVIRPIGDYSRSVHRLLDHLRSKGFVNAPSPTGDDLLPYPRQVTVK